MVKTAFCTTFTLWSNAVMQCTHTKKKNNKTIEWQENSWNVKEIRELGD